MLKNLEFNIYDIYFKMHCLYIAKTELYDRLLTDMRSRYDPTEAYIGTPNIVRRDSNKYAKRLYGSCKQIIEAETQAPFSRDLWIKSINPYGNLSAQGWVDLYENMVKNGEFDFYLT